MRWQGGAALAAGAGALALRKPGNTVHQVVDARTFLRGNATEPETLDNPMSTSVYDDAIIGDLMMGLTEDRWPARSRHGEAVEDVA